MRVHTNDTATADFARLFRDFRGSVRRWATRLVRSTSDADDIVQEVFLTAYRRRQLVGELASPGPWLLKVTSNVVRHHWRAQGRRAMRVSSWERLLAHALPPADPLQELEAKCTVQRFDEALASLHRRYAEVYVLSEIEQLPPATVAALTGIRPGTLRVRRFRARTAIARHLALMQARDDRPASQGGWEVSR
jgi:RNA polymerase sigma-70 factor (ECF subfamily)